MAPDDDRMNVPTVIDKLNASLELQYRSVLEMAVLAGIQEGLDRQALGSSLWGWAQSGLEDVRRIAEKVATLGGDVTTRVAPLGPVAGDAGLAALLDHELEALDAIHDVIPDTGQEARSEALEHRVEHVIMRRQEQVDALRRALGRTGPEA